MSDLPNEYRFKVYGSGPEVLREITVKNIEKLLEECSDSIRKCAHTIMRAKSLREERALNNIPINYSEIYKESLAYAAETLGVSVQSVRDKFERQHLLNDEAVSILFRDYLERKSFELERLLIISTYWTPTEDLDKMVIESIFK